MTLRRLILVADDYGISPAVSAGIRALAENNRLSATGVMVTMPAWPNEAASLRALHDKIAVGLHFTLTDQTPAGAMPRLAPAGKLPPIRRMVIGSVTGGLPLNEIADEFERQLDLFEAHFGAPPDFIDGHQHVHQLPGVWQIVQSAFGRRVALDRCWLRDCADVNLWRRGDAMKAAIVALLGWRASRAAHKGGIRVNRGFSGFYDYSAGGLADFFQPMLRAAGDGHAMMVHPGHVDDALRAVDSLTDPRAAELDYLSGPLFPEHLTQSGFTLAEPGFLIDGRRINP